MRDPYVAQWGDQMEGYKMSGCVARKGNDTAAYKILIENNKGYITLLRLKCA